MFFNDDFWATLIIAGVGIGAYCAGKNKGAQETVAKYDAKAIINSQQQQINDLNAKLNALTAKNP